MAERVLTVKQPWADLIMAGVKDVENRSWPVPSTLPQWRRCLAAGGARDMVDDPNWPLANCCRPDGPFPFRLWIHASARPEPLEHEAWTRWLDGALSTEDGFEGADGVLLGWVTVTGCHHADECPTPPFDTPGPSSLCSPWAQPDQYHWELADPVPLDEPVPMRGRQRLWTLPADVAVPA